MVTGFVFWSCILYGLYTWAVRAESEHFTETVKFKAESLANHAQSLRRWIGGKGGVYVEVDESTTPHHKLSQIPESNINTPSGRKLTLLNSPSVLSQISPFFKSDKGDRIHLVANTPINPSNTPDQWEKIALETLDSGVSKVGKFVQEGNDRYYRLMYPIYAESKCLRCHNDYQGHTQKVIGGLSVAVDKTPYDQLTENVLQQIRKGYFSIWILGIAALALFDFIGARLLRRIEVMATHDSLTQLYNRREIERHTEIECDRAGRYGNPLSAIMLDFDHFKKVNDTYGHPAGDEAIRVVADIIRKNIRKTDIAGRYGGEEFMILAPGVSLEGTKTLAERIRTKIKATPIQVEAKKTITVTASMGVSGYSNHNKTSEALVKSADKALYQAKANGRDRICMAE